MFFFMLTWLFFLRFLVRRSNEIDLGISFEKCGLTFISEREGIREQHYISIILSIKCTSFAVSPTYCLCSNLSLAQTYKYTYINRYVIYDETYMQIISILSVFNRKVDVSWIAYKSPTEILNWWNFILKEEKVYSGTAETFGKQWQVGDVVGVFLDLIDRTISKTESFKRTLQLPFQAIHTYNLIQEIDYWIQKNVFLNTKV